ncbi:MAG: hypothetical protein RL641_735 [Candidatus Parcubacteria bacterium]|jgi:mRNA interferase MazF
MYIKDFDKWNIEKKNTNAKSSKIYFKEREIWWCTLGVNIGSEIDGKNSRFERPVILFKYINHNIIFIIPLTSKKRLDKYHFKISTVKMVSYVKISQMRVISTKRLLRKIDTLSEDQFSNLKKQYLEFFN